MARGRQRNQGSSRCVCQGYVEAPVHLSHWFLYVTFADFFCSSTSNGRAGGLTLHRRPKCRLQIKETQLLAGPP